MPVKQRGDKWQARYFAGYNARGKRRYPSKTFDRKKDAVAWEISELHKKREGTLVESNTLTIAQAFARWMKAADIRPNTRANYEGYIKEYIKPYLGEMRLSALKPAHVEDWLMELKARKLSSRTITGARTLLSAVFRYAIRLRFVVVNPVAAVRGPKVEASEKYAFSPEEAKRFRAASYANKFGLFYRFALYTGLRPEEIHGLQWQYLELSPGVRGLVHVRRVIIATWGAQGAWQWQKPKTKKSVRSVPFPAWLADELAEHRRRQLEEKMRVGAAYENHGLVFCNAQGRPWTRATVGIDYFKPLLDKAELPRRVRLYDLRHSFITLSLIAGKDLKTVSTEAGHASAAFTLDNYGHVLQMMTDAGLEKLEALLK